jgi:POT family proton-dependent oligopeptide transporter
MLLTLLPIVACLTNDSGAAPWIREYLLTFNFLSMFNGHPKGLWALALANTGERFGYYTMLAVFLFFLQDNFGFSMGTSSTIQATFLGVVYFVPLFGGMLADKFGFGKMVTTGIFVMFLGYLLLALPLGAGSVALTVMVLALLFVCVGTGLFKGNLQVLVGNLYDDPKYAAKRDEGFSIFYMAINIGSMFAAAAALRPHKDVIEHCRTADIIATAI